jgi:hypothetical protein
MHYILTEEEFKNLVPKFELLKKQEELAILVNTLRKTDFCLVHKYGENTCCDDCPIASTNLKHSILGHIKVCQFQKFSK